MELEHGQDYQMECGTSWNAGQKSESALKLPGRPGNIGTNVHILLDS